MDMFSGSYGYFNAMGKLNYRFCTVNFGEWVMCVRPPLFYLNVHKCLELKG